MAEDTHRGKGQLWFHIMAIVIVAIWGMTFISTKKLLIAGLSPVEIFFMRFSTAYVGMLIVQLIWRKKSGFRLFCSDIKDEIAACLLGITGGSLYFWSENTALTFTQASNVSFIVCTTPLVTALLFSAVTRKKPGRWLMAGSLLALLGIALIAFNGEESVRIGFKGDMLAMVASLTWAVYTLISNKMLSKYPSGMISRKVFFYGMLTIIPILMFRGWRFDPAGLLQPQVLGNLVFLAVIASLGCYACWNIVIKHLGAVESSNYIYLNPLFTLLGATLILEERMTVLSAFGCVLTLLGVWIAERKH